MTDEELRQAQDDVAREVVDSILADEKSWAETVQVGDYVEGHRDQFYTFSKHQYETKGKLYRVEAVTESSVCAFGDYHDPGRDLPEPIWLSHGQVIIRDGEIVWESSHRKRIRQHLTHGDLTPEDRETLLGMLFVPDLTNVNR